VDVIGDLADHCLAAGHSHFALLWPAVPLPFRGNFPTMRCSVETASPAQE